MPRIDGVKWRRLAPHLDEALGLEGEQRASWLAALRAREPSLAAELTALLAEHEQADQEGFLTGSDLAATRPAPGEKPRFGPGERLAGRYQVVRFIARGGMGEVYECADLELGQRIALKTLLPQTAGDPTALARLKREILLARQVTHPNVCRLFDVGFHPGEPPVAFITMELLEGETLEARIVREGPLAPAEARPLIVQMAGALAAAHAAGVIHRDFKSQNVMLVGERVVVTDFGLARAAAPSQQDIRVSRSGAIMGSPAYMAPEQVEGEAVTPATDLYALGVVMFEMVTGTLPFVGNTALNTALARLTGTVPSPRDRAPGLDPAWDATIRRCMARRPAERFAGAEEIVPALGRPPPDRRRRWLAVSAVALVPALVLLGIVGARLRSGPAPAAASARRSVAVVGVRNAAGRADVAWLQSALGEMLSAELAAGEQLRTISGEAVARMRLELGLPETDSFSNDTLARIRSNLGVDVVVAGSYVALGSGEDGRLRLDLRAQDAAGGTGATLGTVSTAGTLNQLFELVTSAGADLRRRLGLPARAPGDWEAARAALPASPEAARLYGEGLARAREFDYAAARTVLEKVVKLAPEFALGHSLLADVYLALNDERAGRVAAKRALDTGGGLPREMKLLAEARHAWAMRDYPKAAQIYQSLYTFFPDELAYGHMLARAQIRALQRKEALATVASIQRQPGLAQTDPMIDVIEARAASKLGDRKRWQAAAARASEKARARGALFVLAQAQMEEGEAWQNLGEPKRAAACYETARGIYQKFAERSGLAGTLVQMAKLKADGGEFGEATRLYQEALVSYRQLDDAYHLARTTDMLGDVAYYQGDLEVARSRWQEAMALWPKVPDEEGLGWANSKLGLEQMERGNLAAAGPHLDDALRIHRKVGMRAGEAEALLHRGMLIHQRGDLAEAERALAEPLALARELGDQAQLARTLGTLGDVVRDRGDLGRARRLYEEARATAEKIGQPVAAAQVQLSLALLDLEEGRPAEAAAAAQAAAPVLRTAHAADEEASANELAARALLAQGNPGAAAPLVASAEARARVSQRPAVRTRSAMTAARLAVAQGRQAAGLRQVRKLLAEASLKEVVGLALEVRLLAAELSGDRGELRRVAAAAEQRGYLLLVRKARMPASRG
jgi:tetratricopeptide (TPR) repeat protein